MVIFLRLMYTLAERLRCCSVLVVFLLALISGTFHGTASAQASDTGVSQRDFITRFVKHIMERDSLSEESKNIVEPFVIKTMNFVYPLMMKYIQDRNLKISDYEEARRLGVIFGRQILDRSVATLSANDMVALLRINYEATKIMTDYECSQYIRKMPTDEGGKGRSVYAIVSRLPGLALAELIAVQDRGLTNLINRKTDAMPISDSELRLVREMLIDSASKASLSNDALAKLIKGGKDATDLRGMCNAGLELLRLILHEDQYRDLRVTAYVRGILY
jgi:hypothetical protein